LLGGIKIKQLPDFSTAFPFSCDCRSTSLAIWDNRFGKLVGARLGYAESYGSTPKYSTIKNV